MTTTHNLDVRQALSDALAAVAAAAQDDDRYLQVAAHLLEAYKTATAIKPPSPFFGAP